MERKTAGLLGAMAGLAMLTPAQAYADLLAPIPNALEQLRAADAAPPDFRPAQYYQNGPGYGNDDHHHHHHHHHHYYPPPPPPHHHHHHHHQQQGGVILQLPGVGVRVQ